MTDKVQKIREDVEKLKSQLLRGACSSQIAMETMCKEEELLKKMWDSIPKSKEEFKAEMDSTEPMFRMSNEMIEIIRKYAEDGENQKDWPNMIMMALGRTTAVTLKGLDYIGVTKIPAMELYTQLILPVCEHIVSEDIKKKEVTDANAS